MKKTLFLLLFLCTSCSYKMYQASNQDKKSVNIPYVKGDQNGFFTKELAYEIATSGMFEYKHSHSDYKLFVEIINEDSKQIGYRHDRNNDGTYRKNLMATENRQSIAAKVSIQKNGEIVFGPKIVDATQDFDYVEQDSLRDLSFINPSTNQRQTMLSFSLGQMESIADAKNAAKKPLYAELAKKIVTLLIAQFPED